MRSLFLVCFLGCCLAVCAQNSSPSSPPPANSKPANSPDKPSSTRTPSLAPPRSDSVDASALDDSGESSSKDTIIDLSAPEDDAKVHPQSSQALADEGSGTGDVTEFHPWDPHKAAKNVEVGDFYFKRKNYHAAEDRYREALYYKNNDAVATFRLAVCLAKLERPDEARKEYENYLKILPAGPQAQEARKALERLKASDAKSNAND
jgi:tetratricopeptide (TPR) repeat protein